MLGAFAKRHPDVEIRMDIADAPELVQRLRSRDLDVGIICEMGPAEGVATSPLADERLVPVWGAESPMASGKATLERFLEQPFIARERGSGVGRAVDRWLLEQENGPRPAMELGSLEALKQAVLSGLGVSILPEPAVKADADGGALRVGRFPGMPIKARVEAAVLAGRRAPKPLEAFLRGVLGSRAKALVGDAD
jgi:DNA-binding transcriptional LysR family regulator